MRPAPNQRAARDVVPYSTKVPTTASNVISAPATPMPPSDTRPRWPTTAVSTSRYSGSAASTTNADVASDAIRRVLTSPLVIARGT
jgi:hypothetical protein